MSRSCRDQPGGHRNYAGKSGRRSKVKWLAKHLNRKSRHAKMVHRHHARWEQG